MATLLGVLLLCSCAAQVAQSLQGGGWQPPWKLQKQVLEPGLDPVVPSVAGCWVRAPTGCRKSLNIGPNHWARDRRGEYAYEALTNRSACEEIRKAHFDKACHRTDILTIWVPNVTDVASPGSMETKADTMRGPVDPQGDVTTLPAGYLDEEEWSTTRAAADEFPAPTTEPAAARPRTEEPHVRRPATNTRPLPYDEDDDEEMARIDEAGVRSVGASTPQPEPEPPVRKEKAAPAERPVAKSTSRSTTALPPDAVVRSVGISTQPEHHAKEVKRHTTTGRPHQTVRSAGKSSEPPEHVVKEVNRTSEGIEEVWQDVYEEDEPDDAPAPPGWEKYEPTTPKPAEPARWPAWDETPTTFPPEGGGEEEEADEEDQEEDEEWGRGHKFSSRSTTAAPPLSVSKPMSSRAAPEPPAKKEMSPPKTEQPPPAARHEPAAAKQQPPAATKQPPAAEQQPAAAEEQAAMRFPTDPGCYVRTPSGCPNHPSFHSPQWKHEKYGEDFAGAKENRTVCEKVRKAHVSHWCGAETAAVFVPPSDQPQSQSGLVSDSAGSGQDPGCFIMLPTGCPNHPSFTAPDWKHEAWGETHTNARLSREACEVERRTHIAHWCGAEDTMAKFVPAESPQHCDECASLVATELQQPRNPFTPGCFVWTPSGCPLHPSFSASGWRRELYGERYLGAATNASKCLGREASVRHWCGVADARVKFVAADEVASEGLDAAAMLIAGGPFDEGVLQGEGANDAEDLLSWVGHKERRRALA